MSVIGERPMGRLVASSSAAQGGPEKQSRFRAVFYFRKTPSPENRILGGPCGMTRIGWRQTSPKRMKARQRGQRMAYRGKRRHARRAESKTGGGESISSAGDSDENRRKSVCTLRFRGRKRLQCLRAVGPRPDSRHRRMRFYAPYTVPLKGKRPKKGPTPKRGA